MKLLLHPTAMNHVRQFAAHPQGTVLLYGQPQTGKFTAAYEVARQVNCWGCSDESCKSCIQALGGSHPDIVVVAPDEKNKISIQMVHDLHHKLLYGQYEQHGGRVVIIRDAHNLTLAAQNALLKLLEEPPRDTMIILTATSPTALLETIMSRCRAVYVPALKPAVISNYLVAELGIDPELAKQAAQLSDGAIGGAVALASSDQLRSQHNEILEDSLALTTTPQLFRRLQAANQIASQGDRLSEYLQVIVASGRRAARQDPLTFGQNLAAIERLQQRLKANVTPKVAFEAFAIEVVC